MPHAPRRLAQILSAALLVTIAAAVPASAGEPPKPLTDPTRAAALAHKLGADRTGGVYYKDGHLVVTVTDQAAAQTVRDAGGTPKLVTRSAAELASIHHELDQLGGIPNTAWGVEASTNQVSVEIFDGVPTTSRARIEKVATAHPGAIRIKRLGGKLEAAATDLRGANGIWSEGWLCSAAFNTKNSSGTIYTLTAGHCVPGTGNTWYMDWNGARIGTQTAYNFETGTDGYCDGSTRACDWATIKADDPDINPLGTVRYWGGDYHQIDNSRFAAEGESADRIGVASQDTVGYISKSSTTVTYTDGTTLYGMYEATLCTMHGDSGGPLVQGTTALGITSGGNYLDEPCGDSDAQTGRHSFYTRVQTVLDQRGLHVY
ncbi:S1 family peptidase [Streptomyces sp. NPDC002577]